MRATAFAETLPEAGEPQPGPDQGCSRRDGPEPPDRVRLATVLLGVLACAPFRAGAQPKAPSAGGSYESTYGAPVPMEIEEIARGVGNYQRTTVRSKAVVDTYAGGYYLLKGKGGAQVLGIPVPEVGAATDEFRGRDVEVVGLVREIPLHQATNRFCGLESKCEDPLLPALPNRQGGMPIQSITFWRIVDAGDDGGTGIESKGRRTLESLVGNSGKMDKQAIRVVGQFRGRNLYGDLPAKSERTASDWVIKDCLLYTSDAADE